MENQYIEPVEGLLVEVKILEERTTYGKKRYRIEPVAGKISKPRGVWVEARSFKSNK